MGGTKVQPAGRERKRRRRHRGRNLLVLLLLCALCAGLWYAMRLVRPVHLAVECIFQQPELPNGCEVTSLTMVLRYLGYPTEKVPLARQYLPRESVRWENGVVCTPDPEQTYVGNPWDGSGFYILPPGLVNTANHYLRDRGSSYVARDLSGAGERQLIAQLQAGRPVILWATLDYTEAQYVDETWVIAGTGKTYTPYSNLHCRVLTGVEGELFYVADPIFGVQTVERDVLMNGYRALGSRAMVIAGG